VVRRRLDFDALQRRVVNTAATVRRRLVSQQPASYVVFDVLAIAGVDIRPTRWTMRRQRLESIAETWRPPLQLWVCDGCAVVGFVGGSLPATLDVGCDRWLTCLSSSHFRVGCE
jgi:hypothetical protein